MQHMSTSMMAGLVATGVVSAIILLASMLGVMPAVNLPRLISGSVGLPGAPLLGWTVHVLIGVVIYGAAMAALSYGFPGTGHVGRGLLLGATGWMLLMVWLMPLAGAGTFGLRLGPMTPLLTLLLHLVFGAILGWADGNMQRRNRLAL